NCWFRASLTDSFGPGLAALDDGLGFLKGSFCPHYDSESLRRPRFSELVGSGALPDGYAADDGVGLLFEGAELAGAVASLPGSSAYRVERLKGNRVGETAIRPRVLR
ncbi:MAG TPA: Type 1 glutamine amidotransferase-like domain-containing protein, partial [Candidatus Binatus sp.]|nr:Type 1 glutamine amidotransferase-like domain-containing protein [Candidatus Binatus sp.]